MHGRQDALFLTRRDMEALEARLRARGDIVFFSQRASSGGHELAKLREGEFSTEKYSYLAPEGAAISIRPLSSVKVSIDIEQSELIEFTRPFHGEGRMQQGRTYYMPAAASGPKSESFLHWAKTTVAAIHDSLRYSKSLRAYVGDDAAAELESRRVEIVS